MRQNSLEINKTHLEGIDTQNKKTQTNNQIKTKNNNQKKAKQENTKS